MKERGGKLDFFDLLLRARDLVRDNAVVRRDLQERFTHIFVDEFQDTEPLQAEVLMLLASADAAISDWRKVPVAPGKLFIAGDPKQAIYRFRRADVGLYYEIRDRLVKAGAFEVRLTTSFRSVPHIQNFVNAAFAPKWKVIEKRSKPIMSRCRRSAPNYCAALDRHVEHSETLWHTEPVHWSSREIAARCDRGICGLGIEQEQMDCDGTRRRRATSASRGATHLPHVLPIREVDVDAMHGLCAVKLAGWTPQDVIDHAFEEHAKDLAKGIRIAYVAATRARDVLVVPAIGDDTTGAGPANADS